MRYEAETPLIEVPSGQLGCQDPPAQLIALRTDVSRYPGTHPVPQQVKDGEERSSDEIGSSELVESNTGSCSLTFRRTISVEARGVRRAMVQNFMVVVTVKKE